MTGCTSCSQTVNSARSTTRSTGRSTGRQSNRQRFTPNKQEMMNLPEVKVSEPNHKTTATHHTETTDDAESGASGDPKLEANGTKPLLNGKAAKGRRKLPEKPPDNRKGNTPSPSNDASTVQYSEEQEVTTKMKKPKAAQRNRNPAPQKKPKLSAKNKNPTDSPISQETNDGLSNDSKSPVEGSDARSPSTSPRSPPVNSPRTAGVHNPALDLSPETPDETEQSLHQVREHMHKILDHAFEDAVKSPKAQSEFKNPFYEGEVTRTPSPTPQQRAESQRRELVRGWKPAAVPTTLRDPYASGDLTSNLESQLNEQQQSLLNSRAIIRGIRQNEPLATEPAQPIYISAESLNTSGSQHKDVSSPRQSSHRPSTEASPRAVNTSARTSPRRPVSAAPPSTNPSARPASTQPPRRIPPSELGWPQPIPSTNDFRHSMPVVAPASAPGSQAPTECMQSAPVHGIRRPKRVSPAVSQTKRAWDQPRRSVRAASGENADEIDMVTRAADSKLLQHSLRGELQSYVQNGAHSAHQTPNPRHRTHRF